MDQNQVSIKLAYVVGIRQELYTKGTILIQKSRNRISCGFFVKLLFKPRQYRFDTITYQFQGISYS